MTTQNAQNLYTLGKGSVSSSAFTPIVSDRSPSSSDISGPNGPFVIGQKWVNKVANTTYTLTSFSTSLGITTATWVNEGVTSDLQTLSGDTGIAVPTAGDIKIAGGAGIVTSAAGSTVTIDLQGGDTAIDEINVQTGISPIIANSSGQITINGATVAAGTNPVRTDGTGANTLAVEVQISQAIAAGDATKIGLSNFNSGHFSVGADGFVSLKGGGQAVDEFVTNVGGPVSPTGAGVIFENASTTTYTDGSVASTIKTEVQSAAHTILIGAGTNTPSTALSPSATSGVPLISQGAALNPTYGTAVVAGGGTGATSFTPYAVICGGTTSTNPLQSIAGVGTSGQVLTSNGAGLLPTFQTSPTDAGFTSIVMQVFTNPNPPGGGPQISTYTPTANMKYCIIEVIGGGAGGGAIPAGGGGNSISGSGGGAGGYSRGVYSAAQIGASKTVTIGNGGVGGTAGANPGASGGTSSVNTAPVIQATGGSGGNPGAANFGVASIGGQGGVGSGGILSISGESGYVATSVNSLPNFFWAVGGGGGSSFYGGGAVEVAAGGTTSLPGNSAGNYGGGGSGAASSSSGAGIAAQAGGNGANGVVIITEFIGN